MTGQPDLFKADDPKPPKRKFNRIAPEAGYCTFEEFKNSNTWQQLNVSPEEEKILKGMIIEGTPTKDDWESMQKTIRSVKYIFNGSYISIF